MGNSSFLMREKNIQSRQNYAIWKPICIFPLKILLKPWTFSFKKYTIAAEKVYHSWSVSKSAKGDIYFAKEKLVLHSLVRTGDTFSEKKLGMNLLWCWEEKHLTNLNLLTALSACTLSWYIQTWLSNIVGDTKVPLLHCFPFEPKLIGGQIITTGKIMNYQKIGSSQFRRQPKKFFLEICIYSRDTSGKRDPSFL